MNRERVRVLVIGAGVNGSVCAAGLHRAGFDVTVLARGHRYEELKQQGIVIEDPLKQVRAQTTVPVIDRLAADDVYDYVLVAVRKNQLRELLPVLAQNRSACVVFLVNTVLGPEEWIEALGADRVMLGFAFAGGRREGGVIRAIRSKGARTPFGEADGERSPRLERLIGILNTAGLNARVETRMPDWLATHAAQVAPLGILILKHGCDTRALARSKNDLRLLVDALRESLAVLQAVGRRIVPGSAAWFEFLPGWAVMSIFRLVLSSRWGEIGAGWHCSQAPDEITELGRELKKLVEKSGQPAPVLWQILAAL
jgi:2-dehydropantoate 2-reductase